MCLSNKKISIIIPACNEENVIEASLAPHLSGADRGVYEVIVVCNGCSDNTAGVVKSLGESITCLETKVASKANALNLAEETARGFPRIYQDADVILSETSVVSIANFLRQETSLAASPRMIMDYGNASWAVRSYYEVWQRLPYVEEGMVGVGVYAISELGRQRFDKFPDIIADDGYIRSLFMAHERPVVDHCYSLVRAPTDLHGLVKIKTRSRRGGYELFAKFPELKNYEVSYGKVACKMLSRFQLWPKLVIYLYVNMISRLYARRQFYGEVPTGWERDDSSRNADRPFAEK